MIHLIWSLVWIVAVGAFAGDLLLALPGLVRLSLCSSLGDPDYADWWVRRALPYMRLFWFLREWMEDWDERLEDRYDDLHALDWFRYKWRGQFHEVVISSADREYYDGIQLMRDELGKVYAVPPYACGGIVHPGRPYLVGE